MKKIMLTALMGTLLLTANAYDSYKEAIKAGKTAYAKKDYATALSCYAEAQRLATNDSGRCDALFNQGMAQIESGKFDEGIALMREALKFSQAPRISAKIQYQLGNYLSKKKQLNEAIAELQKVRPLESNGNTADASDLLTAELLCRQGQNEDAEKILQFVAANAATADGKCRGLIALLQLTRKMKKDGATIAAQLEAIGVQPKKMEVKRCAELWEYYVYSRQYDKAVTLAKQLESNTDLDEPQRDQGTYLLAQTYSAYTKEPDKAKEYWEKLKNSKNPKLVKQAQQNLEKLSGI